MEPEQVPYDAGIRLYFPYFNNKNIKIKYVDFLVHCSKIVISILCKGGIYIFILDQYDKFYEKLNTQVNDNQPIHNSFIEIAEDDDMDFLMYKRNKYDGNSYMTNVG